MSIIKSVYHRLSDKVQQPAKDWYYFVNPRRSWSTLKEQERKRKQFVDQFFEDESEFEQYKSEFYESRITDICMENVTEVPGEYAFYDAHQVTCLSYYALVRKRKPKTLLETGVYNGVATLSLLLAIEKNSSGTLYSIDYSPLLKPMADNRVDDTPESNTFYTRKASCADRESAFLPPEKKSGWIVPDDLKTHWKLIVGDSRQKLPPVLSELDDIDFFVHDSEHSETRMLFEFELIWGQLSEDGIMLSGHIAQNDAFETFGKERECECGVFDVDWDPDDPKYDAPCRSGYIIKD